MAVSRRIPKACGCRTQGIVRTSRGLELLADNGYPAAAAAILSLKSLNKAS